MNHTVSDLVIRLKNACMARRKEVEIPYSKISKSITEALLRHKFLGSVSQEDRLGRRVLIVGIKYERRIPAISDVRIISKPSLRKYAKGSDMTSIAKGRGITLISTSRGGFSDREAKKEGIGGELLFKIW